jgi:hypothetical protein
MSRLLFDEEGAGSSTSLARRHCTTRASNTRDARGTRLAAISVMRTDQDRARSHDDPEDDDRRPRGTDGGDDDAWRGQSGYEAGRRGGLRDRSGEAMGYGGYGRDAARYRRGRSGYGSHGY